MATATRDAAQRCIVRAVPNGATLHVVEVGADGKERPGSKKTVYLAHVIAPKYRVNKESQDDWAWESREFLRHLVIGRPVWFLEYGEVKEREFVGEVYLDPQQQRNLAAAVMRGGFTSLASNANFISMKDPRRQRYHNDVTAALEDAKRARVGMHSAAAPRNRRQVKYSISEREAAALVETHRGKQLSAVVEYIMSDTTARLSIDDATLYVVVQLTGLRQKNTGKTAGNDHEQDLRNDCHQEAEGLAYKNLMHRDVLLEIDGVLHNKKDRVLGTLAKKDDKTGEKKVWQELLLGRGLLAHHRVQCPYTDRFAAAEEAAKAKNLGRWRYQHGSAVQTPSKPVSMLDHVKAAGGAAAEREEGDGDSAGTSPRTASTGTAHVAATAQQQTVKKLFDAIRAGDAVACKKVLKQQRAAVLNAVHDGAADVDAGGDGPQAGDTPLIAAVRGRHEAIWRLVLDYKPDVDARDGSGATALLWSVRLGLAGLTRLLVKLKADVDGADIDGATPLMAALRAGDADACDVLLAAGADVDVGGAEGDGDTPLICAARAGLGATASALLGRGAAATAAHRNARGETAFHVAAARGMRGLLEELAAAAGGNVPADVPGIGAELRLQSAEAGRRGEVGALEGAVRALWGEVRRARGVVAAEAGAFLEAQAEALCAGAKACESSGDQLFRHIAARNAGACLALLRERPEAARAVASADLDVPSAPGQSYIVPGDTPLIAAARSKLADVCMHLLQDAPAEWVSVRNSRGEAALLWAARLKMVVVAARMEKVLGAMLEDELCERDERTEVASAERDSRRALLCEYFEATTQAQRRCREDAPWRQIHTLISATPVDTPAIAALLERVIDGGDWIEACAAYTANTGAQLPGALGAALALDALSLSQVLKNPSLLNRRPGGQDRVARPATGDNYSTDPWSAVPLPTGATAFDDHGDDDDDPMLASSFPFSHLTDMAKDPWFPSPTPPPPPPRQDPAPADALAEVTARLGALEASVAALQASADASRREERKEHEEMMALLQTIMQESAQRARAPAPAPPQVAPAAERAPPCRKAPKCTWCTGPRDLPYCSATGQKHLTAEEARERAEEVRWTYGFHRVVLERFAVIRDVLQLVAYADVVTPPLPAPAKQAAEAWLWEQKGLAERGPAHYPTPTPVPAAIQAWCKVDW
eukprot:TRINITY_DN759_c0_g1_i2.p1 TRINITY_DN759_c0_g1~~TRINITY_DN759_c0_g1_i2.p1  ORF type:complete len:1166 (+),score=432.53 TRINITY_DN759_c0_g1_i2:63-3560(+)